MYGVCLPLGGPPGGQRVGGAGQANSAVEERRPCWQGAGEASAVSTKHPGGLAGFLSCGHRYLPVNTAFLSSVAVQIKVMLSQSEPASWLVAQKSKKVRL